MCRLFFCENIVVGSDDDDDGNNKHSRKKTPAATASDTGRSNCLHDLYEKESETSNTAVATTRTTRTSHSKRLYHAGVDNFVAEFKLSSPTAARKKLRKQDELKREEEGRSTTNHCHPKYDSNDSNDEREPNNNDGCNDDDHRTDDKNEMLSSSVNNRENRANDDNTKTGMHQCDRRAVKKKCGNGISPKRWQDDAYLATTSELTDPLLTMEGDNSNNSSSMMMKEQRMLNYYTSSSTFTTTATNMYFKTRDTMHYRHSLIQSPLHKHIMAVHESACSNATCTVTKEPFQLLLLPSSSGQETLATTAWTRRGGGGGGGGEDDRVDVLGAVAGHRVDNNRVIGNSNDGWEKDGNNEHVKIVGGSSDNKAMDLLTSAAFLFKTSRRNIIL